MVSSAQIQDYVHTFLGYIQRNAKESVIRMEKQQKNVAELAAGQTLEQIDALYLAGMRVALLDGSFEDAELARLCDLVKQTFYTHNDPIGLMLRLKPGMEPKELAIYQYVLLEGFTAESAAAWRENHASFTGVTLAKVEANAENWLHVVDGILTGDAEIAELAQTAGLLVLTDNAEIQVDGLLWYAGTDPERIAGREEKLGWNEQKILKRIADATAENVYGPMAVLNAMKCEAKAILVLTTDGSNLAAITSLNPPIPVIAIAKRPEREAMLLCQTMRWGTLPTAITRTPESMDVEAFARFVAELYGYPKGDSFVALGHWVEGQNQQQMCCFTL